MTKKSMIDEKIEEYLFQFNDLIDPLLGDELSVKLQSAIDNNDEKIANYYWCLKQVYKIQKAYTDAFANMKIRNYETAWNQLDRADIEMTFLEDNDVECYGQSMSVKFHLTGILRFVKQFQMLFPYRVFFSREAIIKEQKCSICGEIIRIRGGCGHKLGKVYCGKMCSHIVTDMQFVGVSIVTNPFDKYALLKPSGIDFNYDVLDFLMNELDSPFAIWTVEKEKRVKPEYSAIGRNHRCPCGSGKKYKQCCMGTEKEKMDHFVFDIPRKNGNTVKESLAYIETGGWIQ